MPFGKWFQQCYVSGGLWVSINIFRVEHDYVSGGTRVNPKNGGLGIDLTEEGGYFKY